MPFIDLAAQQRRIRDKIDAAIAQVLDSGAYVMGPQVREFEAKLAAFGQAKLALSCGNGTDAIALPLMAWGVGRGDAVFCPSFTFAATPEVVPWVDATPVFVDVLPDTLQPRSRQAGRRHRRREGRGSPDSEGGDRRRPVRPASRLSGHQSHMRPRRPEADRRQRPGLRLHPARPAPAPLGRRRHHQLLPGQAAGLLRRRRGGPDQ
jgi:hypothetical protein